jgi:hypothetical protein
VRLVAARASRQAGRKGREGQSDRSLPPKQPTRPVHAFTHVQGKDEADGEVGGAFEMREGVRGVEGACSGLLCMKESGRKSQ